MTALLRDRSFRRLFAGRSLAMLGDSVIPAALALAILRATDSTAALALVLGCAMVPRLLLLPLGGAVADRLGARTVVLVTTLVRAAAQCTVGVQLLGDAPSLILIAAVEAVSGASSAFAMPALAPLVTATVAAEDRQRANAILGLAGNTARLGGPALAGLLIWLAGPGWAFLLDAAALTLSTLFLGLLRTGHVAPPPRSFRGDLAAGWSEVRARDWYWASLLAHAVWNLASSALMVLGPAVAVRRLGGEGAWIALLQAGSVGLLVGSLLAGRIRLRNPVLVANVHLTSYALPLALLSVAAPAPLVIVAYGVALTGLGFFNPVWETAVQNAVPNHLLARVTSYDWLCSLGAMPLGYLLSPQASEIWGPGLPLALCAALVALFCAGTAAVPGVRRFRTEPRPPVSHRQGAASPTGPDCPEKIMTWRGRGGTLRG